MGLCYLGNMAVYLCMVHFSNFPKRSRIRVRGLFGFGGEITLQMRKRERTVCQSNNKQLVHLKKTVSKSVKTGRMASDSHRAPQSPAFSTMLLWQQAAVVRSAYCMTAPHSSLQLNRSQIDRLSFVIVCYNG